MASDDGDKPKKRGGRIERDDGYDGHKNYRGLTKRILDSMASEIDKIKAGLEADQAALHVASMHLELQNIEKMIGEGKGNLAKLNVKREMLHESLAFLDRKIQSARTGTYL